MKFWGLGVTLVFSLLCDRRAASPLDESGDVSHWKTFADSADWTIKYPQDWQVSNCPHCSGPTEPAFVTFHDSSASELILIERLMDKPADQSLENWLNDVKEKTVSSPRISEEWISLHGVRALKVRNHNADSGESENIYILNGTKTFLLRASDIRNVSFYRRYQQMLSTFIFRSR
jgi:hypothetical protein